MRRVPLTGIKEAAQRVRYSPDRRHVLVTSTADPVVTTLGAGLARQRTVLAGKGPMGVAFHAHGRAAPIANHGGTVTVADLEAGLATTEFPAGKGIETLAHF